MTDTAKYDEWFDNGEYTKIVDELQSAGDDSTGETQALLGLARFNLAARTEERQAGADLYRSAAVAYREALGKSPNNADWKRMADLADENAAAEINVPVPRVTHFSDWGDLTAPRSPKPLPDANKVGRKFQPLRKVKTVLGSVLGKVVSVVFTGFTDLFGRVRGYSDRVWTNWYRRPYFFGIITLAYMRERLNAKNLNSAYPPGAKVGFQPDGLTPPPGVQHFRTADGSWNVLDDPLQGAAGTRFHRNVSRSAIQPETGDRLLTPNPRTISREMFTREVDADGKVKMKEVPFLNMLAAVWIQFQNHDWITHGENLMWPEIHEIPLDPDDPARKRYHQTKMFVGKTQPDPTRRTEDDGDTNVTFLNEVTHWWDGSQIYGSDQATQDRLRSHVDGKLILDAQGRLPVHTDGVEDSGMVRNWWVGLAMLHSVFAHEHNAICDMLKENYPDWDDERLFNVARLINAAVMAKIHSVEWTPAILPNRGLDAGLNANWFGLLTNMFRTGKDRKTVADINVENPELGGVVGNPINTHDSPYGLTQEFVEVYRLHSLLPETLHIRDFRSEGGKLDEHGRPPVQKEIPFPASRQAGSPKVTQEHPLDQMFYSFGTQHPGQLVLNNYPQFMQELSIPGNPMFDMGAIDILRARERGVPRYNQFRRELGMNPIETFEDLLPEKPTPEDQARIAKLKSIYNNKVEDLDLLAGTLSEGVRPTGFGFGETMFQIFILNATRRLQADRFYCEDYNDKVYTPEGLEWVDQTLFKDVILRAHPDLAFTGLANVQNAFEPWDTNPVLDKDRHPLRFIDASLKPNPEKGDAYR